MSDKLEIEGEVKGFGEEYSTATFKKKTLVVETGGEFPQKYCIEFVNSKEELLDLITVGQRVKVHINVKGREWVSPEGVAKYFTSLNGWKIEVLS